MSTVDNTIWIDMDGTMFDFDSAAVAFIPTEHQVLRRHFYIANDYSEPLRSQIKEAYNTPGFFANLEVFPGVIKGWQTLVDAGYHPRILSSPLSSNPYCIEEKLISIKTNLVPILGENVLSEAVIDKKKWNYPGLALIDDRPHVVHGNIQAPWTHILYGWPHVEKVDDTTASLRLLDWSKPDELVVMLNNLRRHNQNIR